MQAKSGKLNGSKNCAVASLLFMLKNKTRQFETSKPLFLVLFPVFFVLHGFAENYDAVPVLDALWLIFEYIAITLLIAGSFWLVYRDLAKASLMALLLMSYHFFFGNMLDLAENYFSGTFILRYRFILPASLLIFCTAFFLLKRSKKSFEKFISYLNILTLILIFIDIARLVNKIPAVEKNKTFHLAAEGFTICDTCNKPDIFLIIPDQYTGNKALKTVFHFDNSPFENELKKRGFYVAKESRSNYNLTPFSMASILNMDYLALKKGHQDYKTVSYSYGVIRNSRVLKFLAASGYNFYNCSIFDFKNHPAHKYIAFLPYGKGLVTAQTFTTRLANDFQSDILAGKFGTTLQKRNAYENLNFNDTILHLTSTIASKQARSPKFVYSHLIMPHYPYYFDSQGKPLSLEKLTSVKKTSSKDYIEYLQYTNKRILQLVDQILTTSPAPPIIVVLGDHGFQWRGENFDPRNDFINLNAIYFPNKDYGRFYDSISNVNEFRVLFNSYFDQHLPLLKDSATNIWD